jgi:hypothetical protein
MFESHGSSLYRTFLGHTMRAHLMHAGADADSAYHTWPWPKRHVIKKKKKNLKRVGGGGGGGGGGEGEGDL